MNPEFSWTQFRANLARDLMITAVSKNTDLFDNIDMFTTEVVLMVNSLTEKLSGQKITEISDKELVLNKPLTNYELSVRALNILHQMGAETIGDVVQFSKKQILMYRNSGKKTLWEIEEFLDKYHLKLKADEV